MSFGLKQKINLIAVNQREFVETHNKLFQKEAQMIEKNGLFSKEHKEIRTARLEYKKINQKYN